MKNHNLCKTAVRRTTASLLAAAFTLPAPFASAVDWDGDFPVDGSFDGKIDNPDNWDTNTLPGTTDSVRFDEAGTYTVFFGTDFETGSGLVTNGDVTFESLGGVPTYEVNGNFAVTGTLTLDGVDFASGPGATLGLFTESGGEIILQNGDVSTVELLRVAPGISDGYMTIDNTKVQVDDSILIFGNAAAGGGQLTLQNNADVRIINGDQLQMGRSMNVASTLRVLSGSSLRVDGSLFMADFDIFNGSAVLELVGAGSSFELTAGNDAFIGADAMSSARFTAFSGTAADFGGDLHVRATGTFENFGSGVTAAGTTQIDGTYHQSGGTSDFDGTTAFAAGATFIHNGGTLRFNDSATLAIQDITTGAPTSSNPAAWEVSDDVAYNRRLRLAGDNGTWASVTVADQGGTDAVLRNTGTGGQADLAVGYNGNGQLFISDRGLVDIYDDVIIGQNAGSNGQVFVTGDGTFNLTDRATLRANRNGAGSNLFVGFNGSGLLNVAGGGLVEVGNDLVVMLSDTPGISSTVTVGVDPSLALDSIDTVTIGGDLLIGNDGNNGGTSSGLFWQRDGARTLVGGTTRVRATGELRADHFSTLTTTDLITVAGSTLDIDGGIITVDGGTATLNHGDLILNGDDSLTPGRGTLELNNGADAVLDGELIIGNAAGEFGLLEIDGAGTTFNQTAGLKSAFIGAGGTGLMHVLRGGFAEINAELFIGQGSTASAGVEVRGVMSGMRSTLVVDSLNDASFIRVGNDGATSRLDIADGALVQVGNAVFVGNLISGAGNHSFTIGCTRDGFSAELRAKFFTVTGPGASADINDGALVVLSSNTPFSQLQAFNGGEINLTGGEIFAPQVSRDLNSTINWTGGTLHTEDVMGDLTNAGGTLAPGLGQAVTLGTTTFANDYTQTAAGTLEIEIAGNTQGTEFDFVDVDGALSLAGTLEVLLLGPTPTVGDTFDILDWGTRTGTFDTLDLPGVGDGNTWSIDNLYTTGVLEVIRSGDLDSDGLVGAADLDIILSNWEQNVTPFDETMGDVTGDGFVDDDDLQAVLSQFGNTTYPGSTMIPEPGTFALLGLGVLAIYRRRRAA